MIDIPALRRSTEGGQPSVVFDFTGEVVDRGESFEIGSAALIAAPLTDAVKVIEGGLVHDSLDRETLLSIEGFALGREVLLAIDASVTTPGELIDEVTRAGFEWQVISPSSSSS